MDKLGPMCRTADDCGLVLNSIAGPDPGDASSLDRAYFYQPEKQRVNGFRLAVLKGGNDGVQPEVLANFEAALDVLRGVASIEEIELPDIPYGPVAMTIIRAEASAAFDDFLSSGSAAELTAPEDRVTPLSYITISARDYLRALRIRRHISRAMDSMMAQYDAVVTPTTNSVAYPIGRRFPGARTRSVGSAIGAAGNVAGLPAVSVPNGFGERGLPTAIQFVGRALDENRILAVANAYQRKTDWHQRLPAV
jgi:aspartyl-tRNA(Asn)/glutamyl-tRNA(Gln) amidotransferase subunit A